MIKKKLNTLTIENILAKKKSGIKNVLKPLVLKGTRAVSRRVREGNFLILSDTPMKTI